MRLDVLVAYIIVIGGLFLAFRKPRRKIGTLVVDRFDGKLTPYLVLENQDILNGLVNGEEIVMKVERADR